MNSLTVKRARAIAYTLKVRYCSDTAGDSKLLRWPTWLSYKTVQKLIKLGIMRSEFYGPSTYGHTNYFVVDFDKWPRS